MARWHCRFLALLVGVLAACERGTAGSSCETNSDCQDGFICARDSRCLDVISAPGGSAAALEETPSDDEIAEPLPLERPSPVGRVASVLVLAGRNDVVPPPTVIVADETELEPPSRELLESVATLVRQAAMNPTATLVAPESPPPVDDGTSVDPEVQQ